MSGVSLDVGIVEESGASIGRKGIVTYCYRLPDGEIVERAYKMGAAPRKVGIKGKGVAVRDFQAEGATGQMIGTDNPTRIAKSPGRPWPMTCVASGVHASQAQELRDHLAGCGVATEINSEGDPVYTSAAHRRKALKARGFHDRASFS